MAIGCFVSVGRALQDAVARVRLAEELGYDAAYVTHIAARDSLTVLAAYAAATSRIGLGTGVVPIYTRTPATMADDGGHAARAVRRRLRLGLGVSHRPVVEGWHGQTIDKPVAEMREYVADRARDPRRRAAAGGREVADELRAQRHRPLPGPADLRRGAVAGDAAPGRRGRRRRDALAVQPGVHPRRRHARAAGWARARGQDARWLRRRGRRPVGSRRGPRRRVRARCAGTCWPTSACPSTARCSSARASADIAAYDEAAGRGDGEGMQAAISERFLRELCADRHAGRRPCRLRGTRTRAPPRRAWARSPRPTSRRPCARWRRGSVAAALAACERPPASSSRLEVVL